MCMCRFTSYIDAEQPYLFMCPMGQIHKCSNNNLLRLIAVISNLVGQLIRPNEVGDIKGHMCLM